MTATPESPEFERAKVKLEEALSPFPREEKVRALNLAILVSELQPWLKGPFTLDRNDCSRLHKLKEAALAGQLIDSEFKSPPTDGLNSVDQTFVVKHDWAAAFANAEGIDESFKLPYSVCAFEFRISGKSIIAIGTEVDDSVQFVPFVNVKEYWYGFGFKTGESTSSAAANFIATEIRAICIALDADVASHSVVRASVGLNEKRTRAGKIPLPDYRVVDLNRKHRVANPAHGDGGTKKRLHFRRGHWRHYETSKTWVKWCLVGDPDLGFISKHYSL